MKLAYHRHNAALKRYNDAKTPFEKRVVAVTYFEEEAAIVNAEMKKKLEEERQ